MIEPDCRFQTHKWGGMVERRKRAREEMFVYGNLSWCSGCAIQITNLGKLILYIHCPTMEEGTRTKKTVFVGGISEDIDESTIYEHFSTFGTLRLSLPSASLKCFSR